MAHMVRAELDLIAFFGCTSWTGHDASIVDKKIQSFFARGESLSGTFDTVKARQIEFEKLNASLRGFILGECGIDFADGRLGL